MTNDHELDVEDEWGDDDFVPVDVAVAVRVTADQVRAALLEFLEDNGDLAGYEMRGDSELDDGSIVIEAEALVESGMSAMEWQSALSAGHLTIQVDLPLVPAHQLKRPGSQS